MNSTEKSKLLRAYFLNAALLASLFELAKDVEALEQSMPEEVSDSPHTLAEAA